MREKTLDNVHDETMFWKVRSSKVKIYYRRQRNNLMFRIVIGVF